MNREQVASGLLALLAVLALGGVAATLDAPIGGAGTGTGEGSGTGIGSDSSFSPGAAEPIDPPTVALPDWFGPLFLLVVLLLTLYGCYELYREYSLRQLAGGAAAVTVTVLALYVLLSALGPADRSGGGGGFLRDQQRYPSGGGTDAAEAVTRSVDPPTALLVVLGVVLLGGVAVILRASGDQRATLDTASAEDSPETDVTAVADAAGRAADRIEADADLENAVVRAWHEMTADLPVERPATSTPAEFADAAVAAGMDSDDVTELTRLFEAVRYGDRPVTEERAARATAALRRIERAYGDGATDTPAGGTDDESADDRVDGPGTGTDR